MVSTNVFGTTRASNVLSAPCIVLKRMLSLRVNWFLMDRMGQCVVHAFAVCLFLL